MNRIAVCAFAPLSLLTLMACGDAENAAGPSPTYWDDMVPIFESHCLQCHQKEGVGPFRLDDYASAKQHAALIQLATEQRSMPPWGVTSDGSCGEFRDDLSLSDEQIARIGAWVEGGAQEGTATKIALAPLPTLDDALEYTTPKIVPEPQGGKLAAHDEYRCFMLDSNVQEQGFITGYEVQPGASDIVHHVLGMLVDPAALADGQGQRTNLEQMQMLDAQSPEREGWPCFGMAGEGVSTGAVPVVWAPGQGVVEYPNQSGIPITPAHKIVIQIHYNLADVEGREDQTKIKLRVVPTVENVGFFTLPDPFLDSLGRHSPEELAPGKKSVKYTWQRTMSDLGLAGLPKVALAGVMPHMHQLGHKYRMTVHSGESTAQCAADVASWDFHWQRLYFYEEPLALTEDSEIEVTCDFDTSQRTTPVLPGWGTDNEMCLATLYVTVPLSALKQAAAKPVP